MLTMFQMSEGFPEGVNGVNRLAKGEKIILDSWQNEEKITDQRQKN